MQAFALDATDEVRLRREEIRNSKRLAERQRRDYIPFLIWEKALNSGRIELEEEEIIHAPPLQKEAGTYHGLCDLFPKEQLQDSQEPSPGLEWNQDHDFSEDYEKYKSLMNNFKCNAQQIKAYEVKVSTKSKVAVHDLTLGQRAAFEIVRQHFSSKSSEQLLMGIYGGPGTGKSIVVDSIVCHLVGMVQTMASMGQAAFHVNGNTIHHVLKVPIDLTKSFDLPEARVEELHAELKSIKYFIIDEISMVSKRLFMWVSKRLSQAFYCNKPFGGRNVILVGDFHQLSPIGGYSVWRTLGRNHEGLALYQLFEDVVVLKAHENKRLDSTDKEADKFASILQEVRYGRLSEDNYNLLMTRSSQNVSASELKKFESALRIIATNKGCDSANRKFLRKVGAPIVRINAVHASGGATARAADFDDCSLHSTLYLCNGARVRLTRTISTQHGLTNGALGTVRAIIYSPDKAPPDLPDFVVVQFDDVHVPTCVPDIPNCVALTPRTHRWKKDVACSRQQFPLSWGWAITIHKAEGQTLTQVFIDTQSMTFASEMLYVALTRVKRLKDLLIMPFSREVVSELHKKPVFKQRLFEMKRLLRLERDTVAKWQLSIQQDEAEDMDVDESE